MDNSPRYRLQMALKSGSGFELITSFTEQALVDEVNAAREEGRYARFAVSDDPSQAALTVATADISGYMFTPVQRMPRAN